jgi:hypothetical protein
MMRRICFVAAAGVVATSIALAQQPAKDTSQPAGQPKEGAGKMELPPGMTEADMQACMEAATPGEMHKHLMKAVGTWDGKNTMWMYPGAEAKHSECVAVITSMFDGRFIKTELSGEMPEMGPFNGFGITGFDNVAQEFQGTWVDNWGTGIMTGTGELADDGRSLTWNYTYNCPMTKAPKKLREVERYTGPNTMTFEMYSEGPDGNEFKMMEIKYTRRTDGSARTAAPTDR